VICVEVSGELVELLPFDAMVKASAWFAAHDRPTLASALWREGEDLGDLSSELANIPDDAPAEVREVVTRLGGD